MAKERVIRTGREGINLFDLLPPQQPGTSSRLRSRRGIPIMFEPPTTEAQPLLANMGQQQNMLGLVNRPMVDTSMPSEGLMQNVSSTPNIFDIDNEKEIEEEIELKKQTKFGDAMARIGGGITLSEEQRKALSPTAREKYNQERLAARNKGIAEMLFVLSDALAGRDVIGRSMERQKARLPEEKKLTAAQQNLQAFYKIYNDPNATQEEKRFALSLIGGIGKSKKQLKEDVTKSLVTAANPLTGLPYTKEEIEQQIKLFDEFYPNSNENKVDEPTPTDIFKVGGYTIEGG